MHSAFREYFKTLCRTVAVALPLPVAPHSFQIEKEHLLTHPFLKPVATALFLVTAASTQVTAQSQPLSDRIAATIAAHEESNPVAMWNPDDWPGATTDAFLTLVPSQLHRVLGAAWETASAGSISGSSCQGLFMGMGARLENEATEAGDLAVSMQGVDACHVAVLARYLSVRLEPGQRAADGCIGEMVAVTGHRTVAISLLHDADPDGEILAYLDTRLDAVIGELVRTACPDMASGILGSAS